MKTLLLGTTLSFDDLDKIMVENGYYSEDDCLSNDETLDNIIKDGSIAYTLKADDLEHIVIRFELVTRASEDEILSCSNIRVLDVYYA